jgi:class 3 adenylate cyclase
MLCVLVAEIIGGDRLEARIGAPEAAHAVERCLNRVERAIEGGGGHLMQRDAGSVTVSFERCDAGVASVCEMLERVLSLPPISGTRLTIQIGLHYGVVEGLLNGEGVEQARMLARFARPGQALASGTAVMLLSSATRHFAGTEALHDVALQGFEWPVYAIGHRTGTVTSIPPNARVSQRLRLRHQQDVILIEEHRPVVLFGRELGNDLVIIDPRASRQHARIERRRDGFILIDQSSNGTYVSVDGEPERCLKHEELPLVGPGRIGCGFSANEIERDLVFFDIV